MLLLLTALAEPPAPIPAGPTGEPADPIGTESPRPEPVRVHYAPEPLPHRLVVVASDPPVRPVGADRVTFLGVPVFLTTPASIEGWLGDLPEGTRAVVIGMEPTSGTNRTLFESTSSQAAARDPAERAARALVSDRGAHEPTETGPNP